jgi:hypothetical protein
LVVGAASFTGVDQASPHGTQQTDFASGSPINLAVGGNGEPVFAAICLGGSWSGGNNAPSARPAPGTASVWDRADQDVMALGGFQTNMGPNLRWDVSSNFIWAGTGLVLNPSATVDLPDASPQDTAPAGQADTAIPPPPTDARDAPPDTSRPDASPPSSDTGVAAPDALGEDLRIGTLPDVDAGPSPPGAEASADAAVSLPDPDAAVVIRDVRLRVGCACSTGSRGVSLPGGTGLLLGLAALVSCLMRRRNQATEPSGRRRNR